MGELKSSPPLFVFSDDWGRHPSSCQHLIRQLLDSFDVHWFNTIGMRPPRLDWLTLVRASDTLLRWAGGRNPTLASKSANPRVVNPKMWPWFRSRFDRSLNARLLRSRLVKECDSVDEAPVIVSTIPIVADLVGNVPAQRWVYYCVDDFSLWPGLDGTYLGNMEAKLVANADVLIAASQSLRDRLELSGRNVHLLTHGVDLDHWRHIRTPPPESIVNLAPPLIVFWGVVDRRLDAQWLIQLARELTDGTIVLVGPQQNPDSALSTEPRIVHLGPLPYEVLPSLASQASVLIMPYSDAPVNLAIQPLKMKEYLATGRPVVVSSLPATLPWADALDVAETSDEFCRLVRLRIQTGLMDEQEIARRRLSEEGWRAKSLVFQRLIAGASTFEHTCGELPTHG